MSSRKKDDEMTHLGRVTIQAEVLLLEKDRRIYAIATARNGDVRVERSPSLPATVAAVDALERKLSHLCLIESFPLPRAKRSKEKS